LIDRQQSDLDLLGVKPTTPQGTGDRHQCGMPLSLRNLLADRGCRFVPAGRPTPAGEAIETGHQALDIMLMVSDRSYAIAAASNRKKPVPVVDLHGSAFDEPSAAARSARPHPYLVPAIAR